MMAYGLPVVASPVGANREIIQDGENGYLAEGDQTWVERLMRLMARPSLRRTIGRRGRATVIERYSVEAAAANLASALLDACRDGKEKWG
jgi:glycosyltransferase involved in cell wall biosynthesis